MFVRSGAFVKKKSHEFRECDISSRFDVSFGSVDAVFFDNMSTISRLEIKKIQNLLILQSVFCEF